MPSVLHEWPARAAEHRPDARALVHPTATLTYADLETTANQLARALREAGCRRGDRVAFLLPRTPMTIATVIGILKADCIYVPLDLRSPPARLGKLVAGAEPSVVLAEGGTENRLRALASMGGLPDGARLGWMDAEGPSAEGGLGKAAFTLSDVEHLPASAPASRAAADDPAYILFTSGSTGAPKGVVITHENVVAFVEWAVGYFGLGPEDRLGGYTELTFDLSTFDLHATFAAGAELHLVPDELKLLPPKIVELMRRSELTHWLSVPSFLEYVAMYDSLEQPDLPSMRWVTWCGDVLSAPPLRYWMERLPHASFANLYGPTETTVASSYYRVPEVPSDPSASIPIGRACDGEELLLLDDDLRPVPPGEVGHIHIRGAGLSPGYWRDPERTREAFLPDPFRSGENARIYRTGDLGRWDDDGVVHFLGREDEQVKTRGFRVELGEVEATLCSLPEIHGCAVVGFGRAGTPGKLLGCAYVSANGRPPDERELKRRLAELLPDYMIPVRWRALHRLPLNERGKVDRRAIQRWMEEESWES